MYSLFFFFETSDKTGESAAKQIKAIQWVRCKLSAIQDHDGVAPILTAGHPLLLKLSDLHLDGEIKDGINICHKDTVQDILFGSIDSKNSPTKSIFFVIL